VFYKYNNALKDTAELEDSLRKEVLGAEEMRAYIDVLK
jgi:hypothetical protein